MRDAVVVVTLSDPVGVFGVDVDRWLIFGDMFARGPAMLTEEEPLYPDRRYSDYHAFRPIGRLDAGHWVDLELIAMATAGTRLHVDVVGQLPDGRWGQTLSSTSITIAIRPDATAP